MHPDSSKTAKGYPTRSYLQHFVGYKFQLEGEDARVLGALKKVCSENTEGCEPKQDPQSHSSHIPGTAHPKISMISLCPLILTIISGR
jgi:hypothetical protein